MGVKRSDHETDHFHPATMSKLHRALSHYFTCMPSRHGA